MPRICLLDSQTDVSFAMLTTYVAKRIQMEAVFAEHLAAATVKELTQRVSDPK